MKKTRITKDKLTTHITHITRVRKTECSCLSREGIGTLNFYFVFRFTKFAICLCVAVNNLGVFVVFASIHRRARHDEILGTACSFSQFAADDRFGGSAAKPSFCDDLRPLFAATAEFKQCIPLRCLYDVYKPAVEAA